MTGVQTCALPILISGSNDINEFEKQTILALRWGYQSMNDKTILDYYVGIGIRNYSGERRDLGNVVDGTGSNLLTVAPSPRETKGSKFFFEVGFNVGLWWEKKK